MPIIEKLQKTEIILIISNLIPLIGAIFFGWKIDTLLIIYWFESAIIGIFNVIKIMINKVPIEKANQFTKSFTNTENETPIANKTYTNNQKILIRLFVAVFFCLHYGIFMFGHFIFIMFFLKIFQLNSFDIWQLSFPILFMVISHGYSFWYNYIKKDEINKINIVQLLFRPYKRIIIMQFTIILGAFVLIFLYPILPYYTLLSATLIIIKTYADWAAHKKEHSSVFSDLEAITQGLS